MSGDVQPRKRKDKKRKKDELGIEEPRGTAAVLGEGDVFMHSYHDHGTGGHWCAKIIFFSLLAVLVGLIGLIILENRGLSELEANAVESRYSGVLDGWLEDGPEDHHHDEHTLDLIHHDVEENDLDENNVSNELDQHDHNEDVSAETNDLSNGDEDDVDENESTNNEDDDDDETKRNIYDEYISKNNEENDDEPESKIHEDENISKNNKDDDDDENLSNSNDEDDFYDNLSNDGDDDDENQNNNREDDDIDDINHDDEGKAKDDVEFVNVYIKSKNNEASHELVTAKCSEEDDEDEQEITNVNFDDIDDEKPEEVDESMQDNQNYQDEFETNSNENIDSRAVESHEEPDQSNDDTDIEIEKIEKEHSDEDISTETPNAISTKDITKLAEKSKDNALKEDDDDDEDSFLSEDDIEEQPVYEHITVPRGKPLPELEDETSSEKPPNTLAEEEEYEKQQAELRRAKEQSSHMWLKLVVGCALLVATHGFIRRATAPRDTLPIEEHAVREETPSLIDRRMTLIPEELASVTPQLTEEIIPPVIAPHTSEHIASVRNTTPVVNKEIDEKEIPLDVESATAQEKIKDDDEEKELYSEEDDEDVQEDIFEEKIEQTLPNLPSNLVEPVVTHESDHEEMLDDVEIIDDEQLEEELLDEEDEDEISDVDDSELLSRLEAKYGRLPEPERPGPKHKDGGSNIEDEWPGEPSDSYWRQQLDQAERELRQDWLD